MRLKNKLSYMTHRPNGVQQRKFISTLNKISELRVICPGNSSGSSVYLISLGKNLKTYLKVAGLGLRTLPITDPIFLDIIDSPMYPQLIKRNKLIVDYSTALHLEMAWLGFGSGLSRIIRAIESSINKKASLVICPNLQFDRYCRSLGADHTCIIPNFPLRSFKPTVDAVTWRQSLGISQDCKVALYVTGGRMREIYGLDILLGSWKIVQAHDDRARLVIIGPEPSDLRSSIAKEGLRNVVVAGIQSHGVIPNWINSADACLAPRTQGFPTWYDDKDSTKISEYASLKKPIVAAGYSPSDQYHLVASDCDSFAEGILQAFDGKVKTPIPHFWEEHEQELMDELGGIIG